MSRGGDEEEEVDNRDGFGRECYKGGRKELELGEEEDTLLVQVSGTGGML